MNKHSQYTNQPARISHHPVHQICHVKRLKQTLCSFCPRVSFTFLHALRCTTLLCVLISFHGWDDQCAAFIGLGFGASTGETSTHVLTWREKARVCVCSVCTCHTLLTIADSQPKARVHTHAHKHAQKHHSLATSPSVHSASSCRTSYCEPSPQRGSISTFSMRATHPSCVCTCMSDVLMKMVDCVCRSIHTLHCCSTMPTCTPVHTCSCNKKARRSEDTHTYTHKHPHENAPASVLGGWPPTVPG